MSELLQQAPGTRGISLVKVGGALAIAGTIIGMLIFVVACFGFGAAFALSLIPVIMGVAGLALTLVGGFCQKPVGVEDTQVLAAVLLNIAVIVGGLLELAFWFGVPIFAGATAT
jgi:hypothetical protein